ncbi:lipopolysaccharide biosynthesis protein [Erwinia mallotivora]|uniref:lipopolysaccharide biosynthesis protein n=1 Tax=Erwinia mallotivora TaxID=69222 RepID=UPI0035EFFC2A
MSIKRNAVANYVGQLYSTLAGILVVPLYIHQLGMEIYGLIGFFSILLTWLQLLDVGISSTLLREAARYRADRQQNPYFPALFATLGKFFLISSAVLVVLGWLASPWIASHWLHARTIPHQDLIIAVAVMVLTAAIRWRTGPFRSVIVGYEHQVWLNALNVIVITLRTFAAVFVIRFASNPVIFFFGWQLVISIAEAACCIWQSYQLVPRSARSDKMPDLNSVVKPFIRFALGAAFSSAIWTFISQIDRLVLSKTLPLSTYGAFTVVATAATGIVMLSSPIIQAIVPRMTGMKTSSEKGDRPMLDLYRWTTQAVCIFMAPLSITIAMYPTQLIWAWTQNAQIGEQMWLVMTLYALGSGIQAICGLLYNLQYVSGNLSLHMKGFTVFAIVLIPLNILAAIWYGALGTGVVWLGQNIFYLLVWALIVHRKFAPRIHIPWLTRDVMLIWGVSACVAFLTLYIPFEWNVNRWMNLLYLGVIGFVNLAICCLFHSKVSGYLKTTTFGRLNFRGER